MPIAWDEIPLPWGKRQAPAPAASDTPASFTENGTAITLKAKDLTAVIDKSSGMLRSIRHKDQEWLVSPLHLNFWRPPTNNDEGAQLHHKLKIWQYAGIPRHRRKGFRRAGWQGCFSHRRTENSRQWQHRNRPIPDHGERPDRNRYRVSSGRRPAGRAAHRLPMRGSRPRSSLQMVWPRPA